MDVLENPSAATADMIRFPGGTFRMGSDRQYPEEPPAHMVTVDGFWIDATPVTNAQFRAFVKATGYVTWADTRTPAGRVPAPEPEERPLGPHLAGACLSPRWHVTPSRSTLPRINVGFRCILRGEGPGDG